MPNTDTENNSEVIVLVELPVLAPSGKNTAKLHDFVLEAGTTKKHKPYRNLVASVELDQKKPDGTPFILKKRYNFSNEGRGLNAFSVDYECWTGKQLPVEQIREFKKATIKGLPVVVEVAHMKQGKNYVEVLKGFVPMQKAAN